MADASDFTLYQDAIEMTAIPLRAGVFLDTGSLNNPADFDIRIASDLYHKNGAVVIGGLDLNAEKFARLTERFSTRFVPYIGGAKNDRASALKGSDTVLTVTGGVVAKKAIAPHGEMHYRAQPPATLFFCCLTPPSENGETTLVDGVALWNALPPSIKTLFTENRLLYRRTLDAKTWPEVYGTSDLNKVRSICTDQGMVLAERPDGAIETRYTCSATTKGPWGTAFVNSIMTWLWGEHRGGQTASIVRFEDGSEIPRQVLRRLYTLVTDLTETIDWQPGDLAIIDNRRVMHGRNAYTDLSRNIIMRMAYDPLPASHQPA